MQINNITTEEYQKALAKSSRSPRGYYLSILRGVEETKAPKSLTFKSPKEAAARLTALYAIRRRHVVQVLINLKDATIFVGPGHYQPLASRKRAKKGK
jgi:hypothetical protein